MRQTALAGIRHPNERTKYQRVLIVCSCPISTFLATGAHLNDWGQGSCYLTTDSETEGR